MNISNEAAYLYVYSKELLKINKQLKRVSKKAEKYAKKHSSAGTLEKKLKYKVKHTRVMEDIKELRKLHNKALATLRKHQIAFAHALQVEHKI